MTLISHIINNEVNLIKTHQEEGGHWKADLFSVARDHFPSLHTHQERAYSTRQDLLDAEWQRQTSLPEAQDLLKKKEQANTQKGIACSAVPRYNLLNRVSFDANAPKPLVGREFVSEYLLLRNSPLNGGSYLDSLGQERRVEDAVSSSLGRYCDHLTLARQMNHVDPQTGYREAVCYAGRPDTKAKFEELVKMIFLGERKHGKHLSYFLNEKGDLVYHLPFTLNSFIGTTDSALGEAEKILIEREVQMLQECNGGVIEVTDEWGIRYQVKAQALLFNRQFNFTNRLEEALPPDLSGEKRSREISSSMRDILALLTSEMQKDPLINRLITLLEQNEKEKSLSSEEEIFCRILLFQRMDLPVVIHCRSCVDRTTIAAAIALALKQWQAQGLAVDLDKPYSLLDNESFKELWFSNIPLGHEMTAYSREDYGFKWQTKDGPLTLHPAVLRLMPSRFVLPACLGNISLPKGFLKGLLAIGIVGLKTFTTTIKERIPLDRWTLPRLLLLMVVALWGLVTLTLVFLLGTLAGTLRYLRPGLGYQATRALWNAIPNTVLAPNLSLNGQPLIFQGH